MRSAVKTNQKSENSEENVSNFSGFLVNHKNVIGAITVTGETKSATTIKSGTILSRQQHSQPTTFVAAVICIIDQQYLAGCHFQNVSIFIISLVKIRITLKASHASNSRVACFGMAILLFASTASGGDAGNLPSSSSSSPADSSKSNSAIKTISAVKCFALATLIEWHNKADKQAMSAMMADGRR
ncbi:hypothetical protein TYRP_019104 [Tyrophagus putrescentiae]|nr:hypothetical protein TYRP_019104 [Tyrophagus putrescentiae]